MQILVFKTDISSKKRVAAIEPYLSKMQGVVRWNVDLKDIDKVLRIEADSLSPRIIEKRLQTAGYYCQELEG